MWKANQCKCNHVMYHSIMSMAVMIYDGKCLNGVINNVNGNVNNVWQWLMLMVMYNGYQCNRNGEIMSIINNGVIMAA
jgi:hypothetical protein